MDKKQWIDEFLKHYSNILMWSFVAVMSMVAVIYMLNIDQFYYEVSQPNDPLQEYISSVEVSVRGKSVGLETISYDEYLVEKKRFNRLAALSFFLIVGWFFCQRDKRRRLLSLFNKLDEVMKDEKNKGL